MRPAPSARSRCPRHRTRPSTRGESGGVRKLDLEAAQGRPSPGAGGPEPALCQVLARCDGGSRRRTRTARRGSRGPSRRSRARRCRTPRPRRCSATCRWTWPIVVPAAARRLRARRLRQLAEHVVEVQRERRHLELAVACAPLVAGPVAIDLDPVAVGVGQVQGLADEVVGGAVQRPARLEPGARARTRGQAGVGTRIARWKRPVARRSRRRRGAVAAQLDQRPAVRRGRARPCRRRGRSPAARSPARRSAATRSRSDTVSATGPIGRGGIDPTCSSCWRCGGHRRLELTPPVSEDVVVLDQLGDELGEPLASLGVDELAVVVERWSGALADRELGVEHARAARSRAPCAGGPGPRSRRSR